MKKTIATILTILLAASTFTACTQASSTEETSTVKPTETLVSTMDESKKPMQETTVSTETVTAETSPVSDKNESSTTEPNKPKKITAMTEKGQQARRQDKMRRLINSKKPNQRRKKNPKPQKSLKRRVHRKQLISPKHRANLKPRKNRLLRNSLNSSRLTSDASQACLLAMAAHSAWCTTVH